MIAEMISPYTSVLIALVASWVLFLWVGIMTVRYARKGRCPVCQAVNGERK